MRVYEFIPESWTTLEFKKNEIQQRAVAERSTSRAATAPVINKDDHIDEVFLFI